MSGDVFDPTIGALNTALNLRMLSHDVTASNIANADTPGYKAKRVEFEGALRDALGVDRALVMHASNPKHIIRQATDPVMPEIFDDPNGVESIDGNTVKMSEEQSNMVQNQFLYDAAAEMLKRKLGMLKYAISEGGGNR